jgi:acetyltransferase-like isoleucine patch superfamily enzyme
MKIGYDLIFNRSYFLWRRFVTQFFYKIYFKKIGRKSTIFKPGLLTFPDCISVGKSTLIRYGCRIEVVKTQNFVPRLTIGDNVNIEQNVHIICHDTVFIGNNVSITGHCAIIDLDHPPGAALHGQKIGDTIRPGGGRVEIGDGAFIGFGSTIMPNVRIGKYCVIGAGSVVTSDIPDYYIAGGVPAKPIRKII